MAGDQRKGVIPADRHIAIRLRLVAHGLGEPALSLQPIVTLLVQLIDSVRGKEAPRDPALGELKGDGLCSVLAKLEGTGVAGVRLAHPGQSNPFG